MAEGTATEVDMATKTEAVTINGFKIQHQINDRLFFYLRLVFKYILND